MNNQVKKSKRTIGNRQLWTINILPLVAWTVTEILKRAGFYVFVIPFLQVLATFVAIFINTKYAPSLKSFNKYMLVLLVCAAGGAFLFGEIWYHFVSSDTETLMITKIFTIGFAIPIAGYMALVNILVKIRSI